MVLDDMAVACRERVFQPVADAVSGATGLSPFAVARHMFYLALATMLAALASHLAAHGHGAAFAVPCVLMATLAAVQSYLLTEGLRRFERSIPDDADNVVLHRFRDATTLSFAVTVLCAGAVAIVAPGAASNPTGMATAAGLACVGASAMLLTCAWRRPRARPGRSRLATQAG